MSLVVQQAHSSGSATTISEETKYFYALRKLQDEILSFSAEGVCTELAKILQVDEAVIQGFTLIFQYYDASSGVMFARQSRLARETRELWDKVIKEKVSFSSIEEGELCSVGAILEEDRRAQEDFEHAIEAARKKFHDIVHTFLQTYIPSAQNYAGRIRDILSHWHCKVSSSRDWRQEVRNKAVEEFMKRMDFSPESLKKLANAVSQTSSSSSSFSSSQSQTTNKKRTIHQLDVPQRDKQGFAIPLIPVKRIMNPQQTQSPSSHAASISIINNVHTTGPVISLSIASSINPSDATTQSISTTAHKSLSTSLVPSSSSSTAPYGQGSVTICNQCNIKSSFTKGWTGVSQFAINDGVALLVKTVPKTYMFDQEGLFTLTFDGRAITSIRTGSCKHDPGDLLKEIFSEKQIFS